ncbi:unnamed protein product [Hapterophycus canaliculatus]
MCFDLLLARHGELTIRASRACSCWRLRGLCVEVYAHLVRYRKRMWISESLHTYVRETTHMRAVPHARSTGAPCQERGENLWNIQSLLIRGSRPRQVLRPSSSGRSIRHVRNRTCY